MKYLLYIGIMLAVVLCPAQGTDVGKLIPVEVVAMSEENGQVTVSTDTGDWGSGATVREAMEDMKATAAGIIYLDTAEYLLLEKGMEAELDTVEGHLKRGTRLCYAPEGIPLEGIADFLSVHKPEMRIGTVSSYDSISEIIEENGKYQLIEK